MHVLFLIAFSLCVLIFGLDKGTDLFFKGAMVVAVGFGIVIGLMLLTAFFSAL